MKDKFAQWTIFSRLFQLFWPFPYLKILSLFFSVIEQRADEKEEKDYRHISLDWRSIEPSVEVRPRWRRRRCCCQFAAQSRLVFRRLIRRDFGKKGSPKLFQAKPFSHSVFTIRTNSFGWLTNSSAPSFDSGPNFHSHFTILSALRRQNGN